MSQALSPIDETKRSPPAIRGGISVATQRTSAVIGYLHNNLETIPGNFRRYALSAAHEASGEHRALLLDRRRELDDGLAGCDEHTIREQIGILRSSMATAPLGEKAQQLAKQGFILVLGKYPAWAVVEAAMRFLDGRAGNGTYAPTAAEMANVCRDLTCDHLAERARINAILDAEIYHVPSEAEQEQIRAAHAEFVRETTERAKTSASKLAAEPLKPGRDPNLVDDLESRRLRRLSQQQETGNSTEASHA